jgi:hypothetical protein
MSGATRPWPPLIVARHIPGWVRWRDRLLTLLMWGLFAIMLETEFKMFFGDHLKQLGWGDFDTEANWPVFFERLTPYLVIAAVMVAALAGTGLRSLRLRRRALLLPQPPSLDPAVEARRAGLNTAALATARALRVAVVHFDADGTHRIEAR